MLLEMQSYCYLLRLLIFFLSSLVVFNLAHSASIGSGISDSIQQSSRLTMTKVIENSNGRTELAVTADKEQGEKIVMIYGSKMFILVLRLVIFL